MSQFPSIKGKHGLEHRLRVLTHQTRQGVTTILPALLKTKTVMYTLPGGNLKQYISRWITALPGQPNQKVRLNKILDFTWITITGTTKLLEARQTQGFIC